MSVLNRDVLYLIIKELQNDKKALVSCLLVNKMFCETTVPILWENPWKFLTLLEKYKKMLLKVIISHLSDESRNNLNKQNLLINSYQRPLFNYIGFCKHLNFDIIQKVINTIKKKSEIPLIKNEIFKLFINENMKFTHLYIPKHFDYQINFVVAEHCLSEIKFFNCSTNIDDNVLMGLIEICKSIKELELCFLVHEYHNNGIGRLIETQKNLFIVSLIDYYYPTLSFDETIQNALIKHSSTIHYLNITRPPIKLLSSFVNLKVLELNDKRQVDFSWNYSLPRLQILRVKFFSEKALIDLIKSTNGSLIEIKFDYCNWFRSLEVIQAIHQSCPYLKYLKLVITDGNVEEFEKILINCSYLSVLYIDAELIYGWDVLLEILTKLSSANLFKLKFRIIFSSPSDPTPLKLFFDNWKGKRPILLSFDKKVTVRMEDLLKEYEAKGIIKNYNNNLCDDNDGFDLYF
ncbi:hypothetical protein RhiirA4_550909 [Rhizophagus irregularis]|uniref:F-box domain-containing protein n=2 Tax=Rhizophagus irregularis TaxID=588596 RepID=A0A2I1HQV9_9GLOM|nr:hypothetical protein RhiirA4_550909 [Rhizophagus irregularis]